jgi:hypothetical protein
MAHWWRNSKKRPQYLPEFQARKAGVIRQQNPQLFI